MTAPLDLDTLELLADIQADLRNQIARRRLRMETIDADTAIDDLIEAVADFRRMVEELTRWRPSQKPQDGSDGHGPDLISKIFGL